MARRWRAAAAGLVVAVVGSGLSVVAGAGTANAAATDLFFSEYVEGSSNNKALEIYNGTGSPVSLTGYSVQMYFNGSASSGLTINLSGTVAAGDVYVVAQSSANDAIKAQADLLNGSGWFNGDDAVALRKGTTFLDVIGQIGVDPGSQWGTGLASTADNTLRRRASVEAGDTDGADAFDPAAQWDGFATDDVADLGAHLRPVLTCTDVSGDEESPVSAPVSATDSNGTVVDIALAGIAPSDPGTITRTSFTPAAGVGGTATATFTASAATPPGTYTLSITATNDDGTPQTGTCTLTIGVTALPVCGDASTSIHDVQGSGAATPLADQQVTVEGIVVGDYQQAGGLGGYYLEEPEADQDADPATSEGIFVASTSRDVAAGDRVRVVGTARERYGQTSLVGVTGSRICASGLAVPPATVSLPASTPDELERYEGMAIAIPQRLTVTEVYTLARFGEVDLAAGGRLETPTNAVAPGQPAQDLQVANDLRRILLDDGSSVQNPAVVPYPQGGLSADNPLRVGDSLPSLSGVLGFDFDRYRVQPTGPIDFDHTNPRPATPQDVGGDIRAAAFNVLNYFNGDGAGGGFPTPRGADTAAEFQRQRAKIIAAISTLDADVVGLMELENDDTDAEYGAIEDLVDGLNDANGAGTYAFVDTGVLGTDAIRVGLLYQPARVTPVGDYAVLDSSVDPRFDDDLNRPSLAQTFRTQDGAVFTAVVNHLKSKGSSCAAVGDPDTGDGQGNCAQTRTAAAEALVDWLDGDPTGAGDADYLVVGDMNSYAMEDPISVFKDAGYVDTIQRFVGDDGYSYVFDGQSGYLDHALASPSLAAQVTGVTEWHINADEPIALDYNVEFKTPDQVDSFYSPEPFRASDHDPVLVGMDLNAYDWSGFLPPVADLPAYNVVKAGSAVPIKFRLGGDQGLDVILDGSPTVTPIDCATGGPTGPATPIMVEEALSYDAATDTYSLTWKTAKDSTSCGLLTVALDDGTMHQARFRLR